MSDRAKALDYEDRTGTRMGMIEIHATPKRPGSDGESMPAMCGEMCDSKT